MTTLLIVGAVEVAVYLTISAVNTIARVTALQSHGPGRWGIASWRSKRTGPLDAHERRWQNALTAGKDNDARWRDFVTSLDRLESDSRLSPDLTVPESFDRRWIERRLDQLESTISDYTPGDTKR